MAFNADDLLPAVADLCHGYDPPPWAAANNTAPEAVVAIDSARMHAASSPGTPVASPALACAYEIHEWLGGADPVLERVVGQSPPTGTSLSMGRSRSWPVPFLASVRRLLRAPRRRRAYARCFG
ncbi:hypothetical protein pdul_cds_160 [Pandoravirus dulcis]|uniref:Uncharacterized protein n=1 Tax=Pandoravirus dulcis TaxID=1349409 RepID=S4VP96_9VIRU|nr:hypothetical protein pdul_cds_160 [Pandoravirus dulcis]AGO82082.1 hypothetical protein pdul_cds_160 [Pandoravirus dulcis]